MARLNQNPFQWLSLRALRAEPPAPVHFLWGSAEAGLMQERSFTMIHSAEKQGKSMFLLNLAVAGARGDEEFLGIRLRSGGFRTLILQNEVHLRAMYERFTVMLRRGELTDEQAERIVINGYRAVTLTNPIHFYLFKRKIRELKPDLVGIDPLAHMLTEDENSNVAVGRGLAPLLKLRDDPGTSVVVIHHDGKIGDGNAGRPAHQRSRGANRLTADPDSIISLKPVRRCGGPTSELSCTPRYGRPPAPFRVRLNEETFWFERFSQAQEHAEVIVGLLRDAGGRLDADSLIERYEEKSGVTDSQGRHRTTEKRIAQALKDGAIIKLEIKGQIYYEAAMPLEEEK